MLPLIVGFLAGAGIGAGVDLAGYAIYKGIIKIKGIIDRYKAKKALQQMKTALKAEIKSKSHNHVSLSAMKIDGTTEDITIYGDGVADDMRVGQLIYV